MKWPASNDNVAEMIVKEYHAISERSFGGRESNFGNGKTGLAHKMTFRNAASNGGFFALLHAVRDEKFSFDLIAVDSGKKAQICAITLDTQSIHHSCHCSFC